MLIKDASLLQVLQTQISNINVKVMEAPLTDILYPEILPVNMAYAEWQDTAPAITFGAGHGEAEWITGYSKDVNLVETGATTSSFGFAMYAVGYEVNIEELGKAANVGFNISDVKARHARRKAEEFIDTKALLGDANKGWTGILNKAGITPITASTKTAGGTQWVNNDGSLNATPEEIAGDFINLVVGPASITRSVRPLIADTVLLPSRAYRALLTNVTDILLGGVTVLEFVRRQVQGATGVDFRIIEVPELATQATVGIVGGGRAVGYRRSQDIVELPMAAPFRFYTDYRDAPLGWMVPGYGRFGEVQVFESRGFRYLDGVEQVPA